MESFMKYLFLLALFWLSLSAQAKQMELIKEHSKIAFDVDYMLMTKVDGQFKNYQGFFDLNDAENEISNIRIAIVGESVDTNDTKRDFHLRGHEFFFVANYPEISFKNPSAVKIIEGQKFKLNGEMTLRGITKPLVLEGLYKGKRKDPWGKGNYFFTLTGELNRKDFDIVWNKEMDAGGFLVGDIIRLNLVVQAQLLGAKTPFSTHMVPTTKGIVERDQLKKGKLKRLSTPTAPNDHSSPKK
jgi:polyisoprenoid-binding protein YceI